MGQVQLYAFADEATSSIEGQIKALLRNGLQGIEIRGVDGENISSITLQKAKDVRMMLDDSNLITWSIGSPIGKIRLDEDFEKHKELLRHTLDVADILGAQNIRIFSFYMPKGVDPSTHRQEVFDRMDTLLDICQDSGIILCHENEKGIYGDTGSRCLDLFQNLPRLQGIFDPANFVQCREEPLKTWQLLRHRIRYLHIKDSKQDSAVVPAGLGDAQIRPIVQDYLSRGGVAMTIEPHLMEFEGLKDLEESGDTSVVGKFYTYPSADAAFDAGCDAVKNILAEV